MLQPFSIISIINFQLIGLWVIKLFYFFLLCIFFVAFLLFVMLLIRHSFLSSSEDLGSSFECGFQPFGGSIFCFSIPFFVVSLIFLLFDVEILLIFFTPLIFSFSFFSSFFIWLIILFILLATFYEWFKGVLRWM